jgi:flavin reductase (DIM6/NTAB) family NADH-FMN oxidoreductase RutF
MIPPRTPQSTVLDPAGLAPEQLFQLLTGSVVPRPIAWTSTLSAGGVPNLAPFSFFTVVSTVPPMLSLTVEAATGGGPKDTLRNIEETGEFVVNSVSADVGDQMYESSLDHAPQVSEFREAGVTPTPSTTVRPPRVAESKISMECVLHQVLRPGSDALVIGTVVAFHVAEGLLSAAGHIDLHRLRPLGRVAARFTDVRDPFLLPAQIAAR